MQWKKVWVKATTWLVAEIVLNLLGLDNLADYSEFLFDKEVIITTRRHQVTVVLPPHQPQINPHLPGCDSLPNFV